MARPLRIEQAGGWFHVTARGNERRAIYRQDRDRQHFCELLAGAADAFGWRIHAYVLMDNHFHLLVETPAPNLSRGMHWLGVSYSVWFNRRHQRSGHLFQGRFKAIMVEPARWGLELSRYIHLNPVRLARHNLDKATRLRDKTGMGDAPTPALVKERAKRLRQYRWSSYPAYLGLVKKPDWLDVDLLRQVARGLPKAQEAYRKFIESAIRQGLPESPWEKLTAQTFLGGPRFVRQAKDKLAGSRREQPSARRLAQRPGLPQIIAAVEREKGQSWNEFRDRYGDPGRDLVLYLARRHGGLPLREIALAAGGLDYASASIAVHRFGLRLKRDSRLQSALQRCRAHLGM